MKHVGRENVFQCFKCYYTTLYLLSMVVRKYPSRPVSQYVSIMYYLKEYIYKASILKQNSVHGTLEEGKARRKKKEWWTCLV